MTYAMTRSLGDFVGECAHAPSVDIPDSSDFKTLARSL
jgi:hypothetical protein